MAARLSRGHKVTLWAAGVTAVGAVFAGALQLLDSGDTTQCSGGAVCGSNNNGNTINGGEEKRTP